MPDASFREGWYARLFERYSRELRIMPGVLSVLDRLDCREYPYCIASGSSYRRLDFALQTVGLSERFAAGPTARIRSNTENPARIFSFLPLGR